MPNVKMKVTYAGPRCTCAMGGILSCDDAEAKRLVEGGYAEYVPEPKLETKKILKAEIETATKKAPPENAKIK